MISPSAAAPAGVAVLRAEGWPMRAARAGVLAASSVALAAGAHRLGGGMPPAQALLVATTAVFFGFGLLWTRRERSGPAIAAVVLLSQLAMHAAFALAPMRSTGGDRTHGELNRWAAMLLCHNPSHPATAAQVNAARAALGLGPLPTAPAAMHMSGPISTGGAGMLALHLVAALAMACWLRRGERAAWAVARRVVAGVVAPLDRSCPGHARAWREDFGRRLGAPPVDLRRRVGRSRPAGGRGFRLHRVTRRPAAFHRPGVVGAASTRALAPDAVRPRVSVRCTSRPESAMPVRRRRAPSTGSRSRPHSTTGEAAGRRRGGRAGRRHPQRLHDPFVHELRGPGLGRHRVDRVRR